jgi:hypothetical protein
MMQMICLPLPAARQPDLFPDAIADSIGKFGSSDVTSTLAACSRSRHSCSEPCSRYQTPHTRGYCRSHTESLNAADSLAERSEFELPVPLSKLSDNNLMLSFATSRRVVKRSHPGLRLWRASGSSLKRMVPNWIALSARSSRGVAHVARGKRSP